MGYLQVLGLNVRHVKLIVLIAALILTNVEFVILVMVYQPVESVFYASILTALSVLIMLAFVKLVELIMEYLRVFVFDAMTPIVLFVLLVTIFARLA